MDDAILAKTAQIKKACNDVPRRSGTRLRIPNAALWYAARRANAR